MYTYKARPGLFFLFAPLALASCASEAPLTAEQKPAVEAVQPEAMARMTDYAVNSTEPYTYHDDQGQGCMDAEANGVCNHFSTKEAVWFSAGPLQDGLADGMYTFAVLAPGYQVGAIRDGMDGNLSDNVSGRTTGDDGGGDLAANRSFTVQDHEIVAHNGKHAMGVSEGGRKLINVGAFDDAPSPSGLYVLAICSADVHTLQVCKFDAFLVNDQAHGDKALISGATYYDANADGHLNPGEPPMSDLKIYYRDGIQGTEEVALDGNFSIALDPDEYTFYQEAPRGTWMQTGNLDMQTVTFDKAVTALNEDMSYGLSVKGGSVTDALFFGNVCLGEGGGRTVKYWGNLADLSMLGADDLKMLQVLNLRRADGSPFDPQTIKDFQQWMNTTSASNMASQLSAQLAAMALNVRHELVAGDRLAYTPGIREANDNGFATVNELMAEADKALDMNGMTIDKLPERIHQEHLKSALEDANADTTFVQKNPIDCVPRVEKY